MVGMGLGWPYPMGIYPLPSLTLLKLEVLSCLFWIIQQVQQITHFTLSISTLRAGAEGHGGETGPPPPAPLTAVALVVYNLSFGSL